MPRSVHRKEGHEPIEGFQYAASSRTLAKRAGSVPVFGSEVVIDVWESAVFRSRDDG